MEKILLIGGGGHCNSVLDTLISINKYEVVGILDAIDKVGSNVNGIPIVGCDSQSEDFFKQGIKNAVITVGSVGNPKTRIKIYKNLKALGFKFPTIVDNTAIVSQNVKIEEGAFIGKGAIINSGSTIGKMAIINTGAIVEHDCIIGMFAHLAPGSVLSGSVKIGENTHIGTGTVIIQNISVGCSTIVGAGSLVVNNQEENVLCFGSPCRKVRPINSIGVEYENAFRNCSL